MTSVDKQIERLSAAAEHVLYHLTPIWTDYYQVPVPNPQLWRGSHGKAAVFAALRRRGLVEVRTVAKWPHRQVRLTNPKGMRWKYRLLLDRQVKP